MAVGKLRLKIEASTGGKAYRTIAIGIRHEDGRFDFPPMSGGELVPTEVPDALHRHLKDFHPSVGTWNHKIGDTDNRVYFSGGNQETF